MKMQRSLTKRLAGDEFQGVKEAGDEQEDENRTQSVSGQRRKREE